MDIKRETLNRYINILMDAKIIYECKRFDLKSKKSINGEQKYYLSTNTDNRINYGPALENVVFNYAKSKGYDISIGRIGKLECDFIMRDNMNNYGYVQVTMTTMLNRETEDLEYAPLEMIKDNYPKYVVSLDEFNQGSEVAGIAHLHLLDFLRLTNL